MDSIFGQLLANIQQMLVAGHKAFDMPLSPLGELDKQGGYLSLDHKVWKKYLVEIEQKYHELTKTIDECDEYYKNAQLSHKIAFFRTLSRRLAEGAEPEWSSNYQEISDALDATIKTIRQIDRKYKLGTHSRDPD